MDEMRKGGGRDVLSSPERRDHIQENGMGREGIDDISSVLRPRVGTCSILARRSRKLKKDNPPPPQTVTLNKCHLLRDVEI